MIFLLSGPVGGGKTSFLRRILSLLNSTRIPLSGFFAERVFEGGDLAGYDLVEAAILRRHPFLRKSGGEGRERIGPFFVDPDGLRWAEAAISGSPPSSLLVVDELGPLEIEGGGHWPTLRPLLDDPVRSFCLVVRESCRAGFEARFAGRPVRVILVQGAPNAMALAAEIEASVRPS